MLKRILLLVLAIGLVSLWSCKSGKIADGTIRTRKPRNIILLIGDGMGLTQISTLFMEKDKTCNFQRFKNIGFINTRSGSHKITDSAAGATAFSTGYKTYNNAVGMNLDTLSQTNLVELFSENRYKTGVVATSSITHATPAAFYAHVAHRSMQTDIARQLIESDIDFFAGGGRKFFHGLETEIKLYNWDLDTSACCDIKGKPEYEKGHRYGYLLADDGMPTMELDRGAFLTNATTEAIKYFDRDRYFLMVEGSQIDWGGHANDYNYVVSELEDFDRTIGAVLDYAEKDGNTLVIVTADHETGGLSLGAQNYVDANGNKRQNYNVVDPAFNTGGHTTCLIPVFAYGPGASSFQGFYENNEIFFKISELMR